VDTLGSVSADQHPATPSPPSSSARPGTVHLVGAGPGDPGLLTVRAAEVLRSCQSCVYDYLVNPAILALLPVSAERHYVGKRGGGESATQEEINAILIAQARLHRRVVRLKGGDPFLFGRGGEEADALATAGVPFSVVPGVTSGIAVPAYAGIPITHRAASSAVVFATGHRSPGKDDGPHWEALARVETLVLYMGMHRLDEICAALIGHGRAATTPVAVVQWGTYPRQRVVVGTLATIAADTRAAGLGAPAITVVGDVVRYRERIRWFDTRPLFGRTVVVTRAREQASELAALLGEAGARVIEYPLLRPGPPASWTALDAALADLARFDWIAFASANAVTFTIGRLRELGRDARALAGVRIAAVGTATDRALSAHGLRADLVPETFAGADLAKEILRAGPDRARVVLPQADNAGPGLKERLESAGAVVEAVVAYRNLPEHPTVDLVAERPDAVCFASSATAERFAGLLGPEALRTLAEGGCRWFAIGPETAAGMRRAGLDPHAVAAEASVAALA
jgi:uroporphyrinogen III methyltransferase/synthase